jgi:methyl-accepting chemotaxis protein
MLRVSTYSAAATEEIAATVSNQNTSIETVNKEVESLIETVNNLKNSLTKFNLS